MQFAVAIKTKDRAPGPNTLAGVLRGLDLESKLLYRRTTIVATKSEPDLYVRSAVGSPLQEVSFRGDRARSFITESGRLVVDTPHGADRTLHQVASEAIRVACAAEWSVVLEDDVELCDDFLGSLERWLEQHAVETPMMYVFGANYPQLQIAAEKSRTVWRYPAGAFYGAQALVWRGDDALDLANWLGDDPSYEGCSCCEGPTKDRHHDLLLKIWAKERGIESFLASVPSFVQHVGTESTIGNPTFEFSSWQPDRYEAPKPKRSVVWVGDAVAATGFGCITHNVCDRLKDDWAITVLGMNYYGDPHRYDYDILPAYQPLDGGKDRYGVDRLPVLVNRIGADVVLLLQDPWNVPAYLQAMDFHRVRRPAVGYLAVDGTNQDGSDLNGLEHIFAWTEFARDELVNSGYAGPTSVVPLGVDTSLFYPRDRREGRSSLDLYPQDFPSDAYVIGVVGRNHPRKRLDIALAAFAKMLEEPGTDNAYLYLHVAAGDRGGLHLERMVRYYGVGNRVIVVKPRVEHGAPVEKLAMLYSSFDVLLNTSQGEGFGLPLLEAMACGVPCVAPGNSATGEWCRGVALLARCPFEVPLAPMNDLVYVMGRAPDPRSVADELVKLHADPSLAGELREAGLAKASQMTWDRVASSIHSVLMEVVATADNASASPNHEAVEEKLLARA